MTGRTAIETIGDLLDGGYSLHAYCERDDCRHSSRLDLDALAARLGRDHGALHRDLVPHLRCSACGEAVRLSLRMAPPASRAR